MMNSQIVVEALSSSELLSATRELVEKSRGVEAELLVHLGEIDERKLYLDFAFPSMFAFCVGELGFSEGSAYNRIMVARAARRLPAVGDALRSGQVHLAGLRVLAPHLTVANHSEVLAQAVGKSKREIEELVARLSPQPPVPAMVRKLPDRLSSFPSVPASSSGTLFAGPREPPPTVSSGATPPAAPAEPPPEPPPALALVPLPAPVPRRDERRAVIAPLAEDTFKVQFTAGRACRDKLRQAQDLLRHRVPDGDLGTIVEKALDLLIEQVKKERFATGRTARQSPNAAGGDEPRHVPTSNGEEEAPRVCSAAGEDGGRQVSGVAGGSGGRDPAAPNERPPSRHIPNATKRAVFERDDGRCTFVDERGRRCAETGGLEFDHVDGFARTHLHGPDRIRLLCRAHNQHAADRMYGRAFMERARSSLEPPRTRPGASSQRTLL